MHMHAHAHSYALAELFHTHISLVHTVSIRGQVKYLWVPMLLKRWPRGMDIADGLLENSDDDDYDSHASPGLLAKNDDDDKLSDNSDQPTSLGYTEDFNMNVESADDDDEGDPLLRLFQSYEPMTNTTTEEYNLIKQLYIYIYYTWPSDT